MVTLDALKTHSEKFTSGNTSRHIYRSLVTILLPIGEELQSHAAPLVAAEISGFVIQIEMSGADDAMIFDIKLKVDFVEFLQSLGVAIGLNRKIVVRYGGQNRNIRTELARNLHVHRTLHRRALIVPKGNSADDGTFGIELPEDSFAVIFDQNFFIIDNSVLFADKVQGVLSKEIFINF